jgi:OFA family oxalate/formate antiporter-like MFS transporter
MGAAFAGLPLFRRRFLMTEDKTYNRWLIVVGAILIQLCLGAIYIWSVFRKPLQSPISEGGLGLTASQATLPFSLVLIFFAIATVIGGRWQDKAGPRLVASVGGIILGAGMLMAAFLHSYAGLVIGYGIVLGIGIGFTYVCPVSTGVKWFPDKRGLITGLSVAGFGAGALIVAPLARGFIDSVGIFKTFTILGSVFLCIIVLSSQLLRNPPPGWKPQGWTPPETTHMTGREVGPAGMLKTPQFYLIWIMYFFGCTTGLMVIGQTSPIGQELAGLTPKVAALAVSLLAIFNAAGRIFWGKVSDSLGRIKTLFVMLLLCGIAILLYNVIGVFQAYYWLGISIVGLCFGGYLAVFPAITADFYGTKNIGINYGFVFTAYGVGGLFGPWFAAKMLETTSTYSMAFTVTGILSLVGVAIALATKAPKAKTVAAPQE